MKRTIKLAFAAAFLVCLTTVVDADAQVSKQSSELQYTKPALFGSGSNSGNESAYLTKGLKFSLETGGGYDFGEWYPYIPASFSIGYQFNPYCFLGLMLGSGYPTYFVASIDTRVYFTTTRFAPFIGAQVGFGVSETYDYQGYSYIGPGFYWAAGPGVRYALQNNQGISIQPAFKMVIGAPLNIIVALNIAYDF